MKASKAMDEDAVASWRTAGLSSGPNGDNSMQCTSCGHDNREGQKFCGECAHPLLVPERPPPLTEASAPLPASIAAGRYEVKRFLGEGAKKRVYLAHDTRLARDVAVAVLKTERIDATSLARIRLEARAMARLGDHPRIVTVYDIGEDEGRPYIVSQHMAGGTLESLLAQAENRRLPLEQALRIADQICQALEHAHSRGIIHRDLKPANVWLTDDGFAKLGDFGLAITPDRSRLTLEGTLLGTVAYMSPEQALGKPVDGRSDLYSLGGILYEMVTGRGPFMGDDAVAIISQHLNAQPVAPSRHNPEVPQALDAVILRLLAKAPADRSENAAALREVLKTVPTSRPASSPAMEVGAIDALPGGIFVGRKDELEQLRSGLEKVFSGRGHLFMLVGEPGIGKTRTAEQLVTYARLRRAQVFVGRCHEGEGAPAYWPWVQVIRSFVRDRTSTALAVDMGSGSAEIAQVVPEVREKLPDLPSVQSVDPEGARFRLFDAIATFLRNAAKSEPLVLILDDLHWADKSSLLLLQFLAREMEDSRLLVLGTYRDIEVQRGHPLAEVLAALRRERVYERILLRGLPEEDVKALLTALGGQEIPEAFSRAIFRETEGNPFFIEEILQHLIEERTIYREGGRWASRRRPDEMGIPESIRDVIGRRLNRLSKECNEVLTIGSVIGREFSVRSLEGVTVPASENLQDLLDEAVLARVIVELPPPLGRYSFSHAVIRETLYGELQTSRRLQMHRRVAEVLEGLYAENVDAHLSELSYHFFEAATGGGDAKKAVDYAQRAGNRADRQIAYAEAVAHYERALQALELEKPQEDRRRCELLLTLGETLWKTGEFDKARAVFTQGGEIARTLDAAESLARAALGFTGRFSGFEVMRINDDAIRLLEQALGALPPGDTAIRAKLTARLAAARMYVDPFPRVAERAKEAIEMARRIGDSGTIVQVLMSVHFPLWTPDSIDQRLSMMSEAVERAEELSDSALELEARYWHAVDLLERGDIQTLDRELEKMSKLASKIGEPYPLWRIKMLQAVRAHMRGHLDRVEDWAPETLQLGREAGNQSAPGVFALQNLFVRREQGRALEMAPTFKPIADQFPHMPGWRCALLWIYTEANHGEEAEPEFERVSRADFSEHPRNWTWEVAMWFLPRACSFLADERHASQLYDLLLPYRERFAVISGTVFLGSVSGSLGILATTLRRWDEAAQHFEHAVAAHRRVDARLWLAWTQYDYASMLIARSDAGDRNRALSLLSEALTTAQELGLKLLLDKSLALKMQLEGTTSVDVKTSIDAVADSVEAKKPDLRPHAAPDGTVTIMFSDMEGFSTMTERLGDREAHKVIQAHNLIVREHVKAHGGYEVELQGDGFLLAFPSASRALQCGIAIQRAFAAYNNEHPEQPIRVRIGLHTGEPIKEADRFFGKTVILAARIASEAQGGEIFVSSLVKELTSGAGDFVFDAGQETELKGLSGTHDVYELLWDGREPRRKASTSVKFRPGSADSVFLREGDYWTVAYDGKSVRLRDTKGLHCIAHLLRNPGHEFHVADLATIGEATADASVRAGKAETTDAPVASGLGDAGDLLDPQARAQYKERLESLRSELEEAKAFNDSGRTEAIQQEIEFISQELSAAYGLGGRAKKAADSSERIRKAVTSRIRESLGRIQKEHAELGVHFSHAIRTGTFCSYIPEKPLDWKL